jgi:hypothetical protein
MNPTFSAWFHRFGIYCNAPRQSGNFWPGYRGNLVFAPRKKAKPRAKAFFTERLKNPTIAARDRQSPACHFTDPFSGLQSPADSEALAGKFSL